VSWLHGQMEPTFFLTNTDCAINTSVAGRAEDLGQDLMTFLQGAQNPSSHLELVMHELGHNLNQTHNGNDFTGSGSSCIHSSVMNGRHNNELGWGDTIGASKRRFGYSRGTCDVLDPQIVSSVTCTNTCTNNTHCVPQSETSPKIGCSPNVSGCDCDVAEWSSLNPSFQSSPSASD
jgi:hypothetical protein